MAVQSAADRHALDTDIRNTLISDMLGLGIGYWADVDVVEETDDTHLTLTIKVTDRETGTEYTVHRGGFGIAVDEWARNHTWEDDRFIEQFARHWTAKNFDYVDFDANITDCLLQHYLFGEQRYA